MCSYSNRHRQKNGLDKDMIEQNLLICSLIFIVKVINRQLSRIKAYMQLVSKTQTQTGSTMNVGYKALVGQVSKQILVQQTQKKTSAKTVEKDIETGRRLSLVTGNPSYEISKARYPLIAGIRPDIKFSIPFVKIQFFLQNVLF